MSRELYIGLISGTSMDGFDCALVAIDNDHIEILDYISPPITDAFKQKLLAVCKKELVSLIQVGELDHMVASHFADTVTTIIKRNSLTADKITALGSHGQTIWHQPGRSDDDSIIPFTLQIGDPSLLSQLTGITTVGDFRRRDMAAGGQAAPLVPAFHSRIFGSSVTDTIVLNIGGMSNITCLAAAGQRPVTAYDTGPGNVLLDAWIGHIQGKAYDHNGQWAASGKVNVELLQLFMHEPYLQLPPPKSTGRELFNLNWTTEVLSQFGSAIHPKDIQATLLEFTVQSIACEVLKAFEKGEVIVCGGGAENSLILQGLQKALPDFRVITSAQRGVDPEAMEAAAFAWMACQTIHRKPVDLRSITGSSVPVILGGVYYHD